MFAAYAVADVDDAVEGRIVVPTTFNEAAVPTNEPAEATELLNQDGSEGKL